MKRANQEILKDKLRNFEDFFREKAAYLFRRYSLPRWMLYTHDITAVYLTFIFAYLLRFNLITSDFPVNNSLIQGIFAAIVYALFTLIYRSHAGLIRHTTLTDVMHVFLTTTSSAILLFICSLLHHSLGFSGNLRIPISVILIHYVLISVYLFFMRIAVKLLFRFATSSLKGSKRKVLIYGAGEMGFIVKRVLVSDPRGGFDVVGFIDDNRQLQGKKINGIPVFHPRVLTTDFSQHHKIETLIIAIRTLSLDRKSSIIRRAMDAGLEILETPAIDKWLNGQLEIRQLQKVKLEDLLGRDPIKLDMDLIRKGLHKRTILVTGAAGSIGSEIVRQLSRFSMQKIILVDQAETPLFHIKNELRRRFSHVNFKAILGDVCNYSKMDDVFDKYHPEIVFHAAAYKHVPLMEENPHEALRVNIGGTQVITDLAIKYGVKKFVMISTDKSVNPTNLMGASKHICELLVQSKTKLEGVKTQFVITRFGNVLGSNGSVIPIFKKQIKDGGPVTVTHPDITRYFMTIPEACELVLEAGFMGKGGEIFVFDMGEPVRILDLANNMIKLSGYEPGKDIKIEFVGLRPGEKLYEEVLSDKENILPTHHKKIKIAQIEDRDYELITTRISYALNNIYRLSDQDIITLFEEIVPEYKLSKEINTNYLNGIHNSEKSELKTRLYEQK